MGSYLDIAAILAAASESGVDAVHPGYGFLAESADFAEAVTAAGITWVGPSAAALRLGGDKLAATRVARAPDIAAVASPTDGERAEGFVASVGSIRGRNGAGAAGAIIAASSRAKSLGAISSRRSSDDSSEGGPASADPSTDATGPSDALGDMAR